MAGTKDIIWRPGPIEVVVQVGEDELPRIKALGPTLGQETSAKEAEYAVPLFAVRLIGEGNRRHKSSQSMIGSYASDRLKYQSHQEGESGGLKTLKIKAHDKETGLTAIANFSVYPKIPVIRSTVTLENESQEDIIVSQVASIAIGGLTTSAKKYWEEYVLSSANNQWFREAQWHDSSLSSVGLDDYGVLEFGQNIATLASYSIGNRGSFSTAGHLPMGMLKRKDGKQTWLWQIENNGSWKWELGDYYDQLYLAASGPRGTDHDFKHKLSPGASFTSVPAAVTVVEGNQDKAFSALTQYRRSMRRKHKDNETLGLIFNDYMNCLMGDPDENKVTALIEPARKAGSEFFVIDAGWYSDDNSWWDDVGLWEPSKVRFPSGFKKLLDSIRAHNMIPGVWLEPEVIGVRSVVAHQLPEDAFFQENGRRVVEKGRYQLDFRHPAVRERLDKVVDNLVLNYGVGYFKFDYNIEVVQGTDANAFSTGDAHLGHQRAYLSWVNGLYDRHPDLVIESCSSGAQRLDYAMLGTHSLQSTSDQQDPVRYGSIAAAAPTAVTPEQSAVWAYPQPVWDDETNALTVVNSLLGRIHLSGRLDLLSPSQLDLITTGMNVYKDIRGQLAEALPFWPIGLPKWEDDWHSLGLTTTKGDVLLAVWHLKGSQKLSLPIAPLKEASDVSVELLYPAQFETQASWNGKEGTLDVQFPAVVSARLFRLRSL
ncbi:hypothetical protein HRR83_000799 [Exophiala dermatitidis]|uniref:alpha-galactosidase n=1 Tax=Exophiala dermatitidis TaxID=5970 RepID=A0AAN6F2J6_EXODE|nr:hypothetical protein HRR75_000724 [Exophiala dermatitidis]KAJ4528048.1 hypothetical protein HRR74_000803 [Exophiala dermatitidis]KAJ4528681.1 hypothetical protein HRR73_001304 [Exophiala dermatitidis]KAJ4530062.1 hypothetical protein HRR76_009300 [Exophiala dermatitidis]KAJ4553021.1 hypothetical protein HRR78_003280 [Exophiala dermatitidis]